jgi:pilus assembly protein CpaE
MNEKPAVVILDPDPGARAEMHRTLTLANVTVLTEGGHGVEGLTLVSEVQSDCILLGLEAPVERGLQTLEAISSSRPGLPIIVYSTIDDGQSVRRAMVSGASDYLAAPLSGRIVSEAIYTAVERSRPSTPAAAPAEGGAGSGVQAATGPGMVITVFGAKGGIGKSTISTNLAVALARDKVASVALVDMDTRFGDVAIMLDANPRSSLAEASRDAGTLDRTTIRNYLTPHESGVVLLPATTSPQDWDAVTPEQVERVVHLLAQTHDYVILDTPGTFNELVAAALDLATVVLLVTSMELTSIKDTSVVLNMLRSWSFPEEKVRLMVNHSNLANSVKETDISRTLDYRIFWSIPYDEAVSKSTQVGRPVVMWQPRSRAATNLNHLAELVGGAPIRTARPTKPARGGLFQKFKVWKN